MYNNVIILLLSFICEIFTISMLCTIIPSYNHDGEANKKVIVGFTLTAVNEFRRLLSQFSTNCRKILHTLFSIHVVTTLKVLRSFDKYLRSWTI